MDGERRFDAAAGGERLKLFVLRAIVGHPKLTSVTQLAKCASLQRNSVYAWFNGTARPTTGTLARVGDCLDVSLTELLEVYEGRAEEPTTAELELSAHREALERQTQAIERLIRILTSGAVAAGVLRALDEEGDGSSGTPPS